MLVVALVAVNVYVWAEKYTVDLHARYDAGFTVGYTTGNHTGYSLGYDRGYIAGNHTGYAIGYAAGNATGYPAGHTEGLADGYASGYDDGYLQGVADGVGSGYVIRDPTYREALAFIASDPTDLNEYTDTYTCHDFTADVKNSAFTLGYRCGYVYILLEEGAHAIVCFQTTDRGIIFIEPQDDRIVELEVGEPYWDRTYYLPPSFDDTIVSYDVIW